MIIENIISHEPVWVKSVNPLQNAGEAAARLKTQVKQARIM